MKNMHKAAWTVLCTVLTAHAQNGQDSTAVTRLDEVVITDTRVPIPREQSGKTVIRLDAEALKAYQGGSVADVLNRQAGFEIGGGRGRPGEVLGLYARGGRGRQVLVLVDGVRVNDPSSFSQQYDLRLLPLDQVASIEIVKGAASTLYGTNAATAVIDIRTRKPADRPLELSVQNSAGTHRAAENDAWTFGQYTSSLGLSGTSGAFSYQAGFSHRLANGLSALATDTDEKDAYRNSSFNARLSWLAGQQTRLSVFADRTRMKTGYDDAFGGTDAPHEYQTDQERIGTQFQYTGTGFILEAYAAYAAYASEDRGAFPAAYTGGNWAGEVLVRKPLDQNLNLVAGVQYLRDRADLEAPESFTLIDPFVNVVWGSAKGFNLNAGARLNLHSEYGSQWVYQLNPSWTLPADGGYWKVFGSFSTAYITPTLQQLYGAFGANPDLEPETDRSLEAGLEGRPGETLRWSLLYFNRREQQAVVFDNANFAYFNAADDIRVSGVEIEGYLTLSEGWNLQANYTFTERQGDAAIRIPKHKFNALLSGSLAPRWQGTLAYAFTGDRPDTDFSTQTQVELDAFSLVDARLRYTFISDRLEAFLAVNNIFNTEFTEVVGYQTPGRTAQLGWSFRF
ncbi:TonB-dependent receptor [Robiginitalea sp. M366]|uniref:TonB-dependent receptor plug domain-containing protein n=1 Tax=Robiginitalea aestuariiviva TaxID=3036903 RepID=UPI00240D20E4|nr:TonB-dependent receptor [Robiginitalea aestuariiviva]MDG1573492.1 TonB-dependent receptor [Robiginitalea aestuariiviva]